MEFDQPFEPRCPACGWPADSTEPGSSHRTGSGTVRYRRCVCGGWLLTLDGTLIAAPGVHPPDQKPAVSWQ